MIIKPILAYVRDLLTEVLEPGDFAVDGTVGNGHDTLFLAQQVGKGGRVYGFDIQNQALAKAKARLTEAGVAEQVTFFLDSHAQMLDLLPADVQGRVKAVTFNFGYLPGGDESVVTLKQSSLQALQASLQIVQPGGIVTAVLYSGHEEGKVETKAILEWAARLELTDVHVLLYRFHNQKNDPPVLLAFEKRC